MINILTFAILYNEFPVLEKNSNPMFAIRNKLSKLDQCIWLVQYGTWYYVFMIYIEVNCCYCTQKLKVSFYAKSQMLCSKLSISLYHCIIAIDTK